MLKSCLKTSKKHLILLIIEKAIKDNAKSLKNVYLDDINTLKSCLKKLNDIYNFEENL